MPTERNEVQVRRARPRDDHAIVALRGAQEPDGPPLTAERFREDREETASRGEGEQYAAVLDGRVVGCAGCRWAWWTGQPAVYEVSVRVDCAHARRGTATRLTEVLRGRLALRGAARAVAWLRADCEGGRAFAARLGFHETGQAVQDHRLDIARADLSAFPGLDVRLAGEGLRVAALCHLPWQDIAFQRSLQYVWADSGAIPPDVNALRASFDTWRAQVLEGSGLSPETHWVALDGERPVAMTFLRRLSRADYENDYTGVVQTHRRRGIAAALKLHAIRWAREQGAASFWTSTAAGSAGMADLNRRLGYVPGARRVEVKRDLP